MAVDTLLGSDAPDRINFLWFMRLIYKVHLGKQLGYVTGRSKREEIQQCFAIF